MFVEVKCPTCGYQFTVPLAQENRRVICENCQSPFIAVPQPSPPPVATAPESGGNGASPPGPASATPPGGAVSPPAAPFRPAAGPAPAASSTPPGTSPAPPAGPAASPAAAVLPPPAPPGPANRTILAPLAPPEEPIRYHCPRCSRLLEAPRSQAGQKHSCPSCGQRLQIPQPSLPSPAFNKTVLATPASSSAPASPVASSVPPPASPAAPPATIPVAAVVEETCLECGRSLRGLGHLPTCSRCGAQLCSARCLRDHERFAHAPSERRQRATGSGFRCPYCGTSELPYITTRISDAGWVVFVLMLILCFPLFWIGFLMTEDVRHCAACGARLG